MGHAHPAVARGRAPVDQVLVLVLAKPGLVMLVLGGRADQEPIVPVWVASVRVFRVQVADDPRVVTAGSGRNRRLTPNGGQPKFVRHADRVAPR
jgi:hypothetical protein